VKKIFNILSILSAFILLIHSVAFAGNRTKIKDIRHSVNSEYVRVVIEFNRLPLYSSHILENPDRFYFDIEDTSISKVAKTINIKDKRVKGIRIGQFDKKIARVVLDFGGANKHKIFTLQSPPRLVVDISEEKKAFYEERKPEVVAPSTKETGPKIQGSDFKRENTSLDMPKDLGKISDDKKAEATSSSREGKPKLNTSDEMKEKDKTLGISKNLEETECKDNFKKQALEYLEQEKFQEAYDVLFRCYESNKDDIETNFLLGQACFGMKKFDDTIKYYDFILSKSPELHRVRLELARAYFEKGQYKEAKKEFEAVLATKPPPVVGQNIQRFLDMIEAHKPWTARVSAGYVYDSNVNTGPTADSVLLFGIPFELAKDLKEKSDSGYAASLFLGHVLPVSRKFAWQSEFSFSHTGYNRYTDKNADILSLSTGPSLRGDNFAFSFPFILEHTEIGSDNYSDAFGVSPQLQFSLTKKLILSPSLTLQKRQYAANPDRTGTVWSASGLLRYNIGDNSFVQAGYRHTEEDTKRAYLDNKSDSVNIGFYSGLPYGFSVFIQPGISWNTYRESEAAFDRARDDLQYTINTNLSKSLGKGWNITLGYTYTRNDSNLAIYDYKRNQFIISTSKTF
jgi:tetratricopeptide (TPR) repeat protein